jgi:hypothetical protein
MVSVPLAELVNEVIIDHFTPVKGYIQVEQLT